MLGFNAFSRWFGAEVIERKDFLLPFVAFYRWFCACGVTVRANFLLNFLIFDARPSLWRQIILSALIAFYNWLCKRATAKAGFLGSCRKYILIIIYFVRKSVAGEALRVFTYFPLSISTLISWAIDCWSRCSRLVWCFCLVILCAGDCAGRYVAFLLWMSSLVLWIKAYAKRSDLAYFLVSCSKICW